jgi:hypothetical protein
MAYEKFQKAPNDNLLAQVSLNVKEAMRIATRAKFLLKELIDLKAQFKHITEEVLPELATQTDGQTEFLISGEKIKIVDVVRASFPSPTTKDPELKKNRSRILQWLDEKNYGAIVNREFRIFLGRKDTAEAAKIQNFIKDNNLPGGSFHSIHHMTMNKFAKECLEGGVDLPEFFKVQQIQVAKLPPAYKVAWSDIKSPGSDDED